jgi:hypothetical protein
MSKFKKYWDNPDTICKYCRKQFKDNDKKEMISLGPGHRYSHHHCMIENGSKPVELAY